jgi:pyridoxine kinase
MSSPSEQDRILSIQSHVVSGYVGNKASVFPLQLLGFDVDVVNSVHFSNHTGYAGGVEGDVLQGEQLVKLLEGLERNGLLQNIGHLLTGYIGSESFLRQVIHVLQTLRKHREVRFVCDPVLGDAGHFYVPRELVQVYREQVIPLANVVTPNQFEVEQLTGISCKTIQDALKACRALHNMGPQLVFITSIVLEGDDSIAILASQQSSDGTTQAWRIDSPLLPGQYTGTGDLCAALLLGHTANSNEDDLPCAMEKVANSMFAIIQRTHESSNDDSVASRELKLVQSKRDIENPPDSFKAYRIQ